MTTIRNRTCIQRSIKLDSSSMDEFVTCYTLKGEAKRVKKVDLSFRPSTYGIVIHEGKILMTVVRSTGRYSLPGGGIEIGELMEAALKREMMEECGIEIEIIAPAFFKETFFYYEPLEKAWQCHLFVSICRPLSFDLSDELNEEGDEEERPQWVDIQSLQAKDIQVCGEEILRYIRSTVLS